MRNLFILIFAVLLMQSCAESELFTTNGYRYIIHKDEAGPTVQPTQAAQFYFKMLKGDSLVMDSREQNPDPQSVLLPEDPNSAKQKSFIFDALQLMSVGDSISIFLPLDTIKQRPPGFGPNDELRYDLTLVDVMDGEEFQAKETARNEALRAKIEKYQKREPAVADSTKQILAQYKKGSSKAGFTKTASGLMYKILSPGNGPNPQVGQPVLVSYYGVLISDGTMFDNSFKNGRPIDFPLGQGAVIKGWDEGIGLLQPGTRAVLAIPSDLAYGPTARGPIPADADLMFYVELEEIGQ